jgi:hypothetical protein
METVSALLTSATNNWKYIAAATLVLGVIGYLVYRKFWANKQGFSNMGDECNPQIENACGKGAICQSDESGTKGVCFPLSEDVVDASPHEEEAQVGSEIPEEEQAQEQQQEESSS